MGFRSMMQQLLDSGRMCPSCNSQKKDKVLIANKYESNDMRRCLNQWHNTYHAKIGDMDIAYTVEPNIEVRDGRRCPSCFSLLKSCRSFVVTGPQHIQENTRICTADWHNEDLYDKTLRESGMAVYNHEVRFGIKYNQFRRSVQILDIGNNRIDLPIESIKPLIAELLKLDI